MRKEIFLKVLNEHHTNCREIAKVLEINRTTLSRKLNGNNDFTRSEIAKIKDELNLNANDINRIFFEE